MIALLKYGSGFPLHRLGRLQGNLGVPLAPATQWKIVSHAARGIEPVYEELIRQAAQGKVVHNDDTAMLEDSDEEEAAAAAAVGEPTPTPAPTSERKRERERTGIFTSGIVSLTATASPGRRNVTASSGRSSRAPAGGGQSPRLPADAVTIALFFTGRKHAGENLAQVLARRASGLSPPIRMCDALSRNVVSGGDEELRTILANCRAHGRRQFVDVAEAFPEECEHILKVLQRVYRHDAVAKKRGMTATERLKFYRDKSGPLMEKLHAWMSDQTREKKVKPNSGLGEAIGYMPKHWDKWTLFLHRPSAPLDRITTSSNAP